MLTEVVVADPQFDVVLIGRGGVVGRCDVRIEAGTVAQVLEAPRYLLRSLVGSSSSCTGIIFKSCLPDSPYPPAEALVFPDEIGAVTGVTTGRIRSVGSARFWPGPLNRMTG